VSDPVFIHGLEHATEGGAPPTWVVQQARRRLLRRGFVVLPSDTCYSLAALAIDDETYDSLNSILGRPPSPVSLVFPSLLRASEFVELSNYAATLFERLTPGPITIVAKATHLVPAKFLSHAISSARGTIGARISDSIIERDIAASIQYPLITAAVREPATGAAVRSFDRAIEIVRKGTETCPATWGAIEGKITYSDHSTVIEVLDEKIRLIRDGHVPYSEIQETLRQHPISEFAMEDWD
jgi:L-threonylcarbamoyladenylate synthase